MVGSDREVTLNLGAPNNKREDTKTPHLVAIDTLFLLYTYTSHPQAIARGRLGQSLLWEGPTAPYAVIGLQSNVLPSHSECGWTASHRKSGDKSLILLAQEAPEVWHLARSVFKYPGGHSSFYTRPRRQDAQTSRPVKKASGRTLPIAGLIECWRT